MTDQHPPRRPVIEMTIEGDFRDPPRPPLMTKVLGVAIMVAVVAGALALASFAIWLALILVPVTIVAAAVAYGLFRWKLWQARRAAGGGGVGGGDIFRP